MADGWTLIFYRAPPSPPQLECDDSLIELASEDLVVDDVILLSAGCRVPADARLVEAGDVLVDESIVTGESQPVEHSPAAHAEVMSGTYVLRGRGMAQVTMWATWASWQKVSSWPPWW